VKLGTVWLDGTERVVVASPDDDSRTVVLDRGITMRGLILDGLRAQPDRSPTVPVSSLLGQGQPIRLRREYGRVHPEPELAVVIGAGGRDITGDAALGHVFGYTIINDLTSPTMRAEDTFHYRAIHPRPGGADGIEYVDTWVSYPGRYKGTDGFGLGTLSNPVELV
jgi:hypothetical protein